MERLRYVARASSPSQTMLVEETAGALAAIDGDPASLVMASRRLLAGHPLSGPMWWLTSRVLTSGEPRREAWQAVEEIGQDQTARQLGYSLPEGATVCVLGWPEIVAQALPSRGDLDVLVVDALGEASGLIRRLEMVDMIATDVPESGLGAAAAGSDLVVVEASAAGPDGFVAIAGTHAAAAVAHHAGVPVWLVAGVGRWLPRRVWEAIADRLDQSADPWDCDDEVVPLDLIDQVVGPDGLASVPEAVGRTDCPIAPELFRQGVVDSNG